MRQRSLDDLRSTIALALSCPFLILATSSWVARSLPSHRISDFLHVSVFLNPLSLCASLSLSPWSLLLARLHLSLSHGPLPVSLSPLPSSPPGPRPCLPLQIPSPSLWVVRASRLGKPEPRWRWGWGGEGALPAADLDCPLPRRGLGRALKSDSQAACPAPPPAGSGTLHILLGNRNSCGRPHPLPKLETHCGGLHQLPHPTWSWLGLGRHLPPLQEGMGMASCVLPHCSSTSPSLSLNLFLSSSLSFPISSPQPPAPP